MAGNYPDVPSNRMALDRDGSQLYKIDAANVITELTSSQIRGINNETTKGLGDFNLHGQNQFAWLVVFFSEKRDLFGYYFNMGNASFGNTSMMSAEVSTNSTNGVDGTWTTISAAGYLEAMSPNYRTKIQSVTALGIRAIRWRTQSGAPSYGCFPGVHLYGRPSAGQNPNRLNFWHPTSDAAIGGAYFDWGNTPRGSSADRTVRVKNMSASLTANDITVSFDILTDASPSVPAQFLASTDGTTFEAAVAIATLAPGGISPILTVRRNTPVDADLSVWAPRVLAEAGSWA